jgi:hypothetical protein
MHCFVETLRNGKKAFVQIATVGRKDEVGKSGLAASSWRQENSERESDGYQLRTAGEAKEWTAQRAPKVTADED